MFKLRRYLKPFIGNILVIFGLLFSQAMCELTMPDYMSDIVNVGIHAGGIEDGVFDVIRESEYDKLAIFMDADEGDIFFKHYDKIDVQTASDEQIKKYPILKKESVYVLKELHKDERATLAKALQDSESIVLALQQGKVNEVKELQQALAKMPEGSDVFTLFEMMPKEKIAQIKAELQKTRETLGESTMQTANAQYVRQEYKEIGIDTEKLQYTYLFKKGFMMLLVALMAAFCSVAVGFLAAKVAAGTSFRLRNDIFTKVESFSSSEFNTFSTNTLITRTTNDVQQMQMVIVMILRIVIYAPIIGIGAIVKVISTNVSMTWIIGLVIVIILSIMMVAFTCVMPKFKSLQKLMDGLNRVVRESLDGMSVIRAFNNETVEEAKFEKANHKIMRTNLFTARAMSTLMPLIMLVMNSATILIVWVGAHQIDEGVLQIGDMMAFMQYTMQIIMAFMMITMISIMLPRASVAAGRIYEVLTTDVKMKEIDHPKPLKGKMSEGIEFKHVSFKYPNAEEEVLKDISFKAMPGEMTAFIGSTGSGKSTIINLVPRFYDVSQGSVFVNGIDVRELSLYDLREQIGYVPQKGTLFSGTIESNLRYAKADASENDLLNAAQIAQALEFINDKPEGLQTPITQGGTNVSGGQRQRLAIARALVKNPAIYIFDDTFSALDFKTDAKLRKALKTLCEKNNSTVLLVAQRISSIMHAQRIVVLDEGCVVGIGTHEELMKTCKVYQEIAYSQLSKEELANESI